MWAVDSPDAIEGAFFMEDFEKLGAFYLGRQYDLSSKQAGGSLLYDSKDLVTHGVCVGMTGSGKTGLCIGILEEAAIDGVPAIVIDPKGDLADLLLTFPDLTPENFRPWISEEEAGKKGLTPDQFAQQQADMWKKGLADWGQDPARIRRLKDACDFTIYTPGSTAGIPVSILKSFAAPAPVVRADEEALRDRVGTAVTSMLGLIGVPADPIKSREHILLSTLFYSVWSAGKDLDLAGLIQQIQTPPFARVGVLDLDAFYPAKDRFELAMLFNNLLAAPTFQTWLEGEALDIGRMFFTAEGRPRVSVFSIAHLSDAERMFFVSLLLNEVLGWVRAQPGTGSLRALVYMDEIFGFFPPVAEPSSKKPLLTLLKQARAFGVGILLATQNPVDLDYKGLANAGTWFIGRLQTERDKDRLLEGLEGVAAGAATRFDRQEMEETLAGLGNRVFLMYNAHEDEPVVFQTRWTMSYLCGPLTRTQIKTLMDPRRPEFAATGAAVASPAQAVPAVSTAVPAAAAPDAGAGDQPSLPPEIPQFYLPVRGTTPIGGTLLYQPGVLAAATVSFVSADTGAATSSKVRRIAQAPESALALNWDGATVVESPLEDLDRQPFPGAAFAPLPAAMTKLTSYRSWESDFSAWAYRTQAAQVFKSPGFGLTSNPGESEGEFRARLQLVAREKRDELTEKIRSKYSAKTATLQQQLLRAEHAVQREEEQAKNRKMQTAISFGATLLGAFTGRKIVSSGNLGRATTAMRDVGRTMDEQGDIKRAEESLTAMKQKRADLEADFQAEVDAIGAQMDPMAEALDQLTVRPRKSDIAVDSMGLVWTPYWRDASGSLTRASG
jgi:hypothetical protein